MSGVSCAPAPDMCTTHCCGLPFQILTVPTILTLVRVAAIPLLVAGESLLPCHVCLLLPGFTVTTSDTMIVLCQCSVVQPPALGAFDKLHHLCCGMHY